MKKIKSIRRVNMPETNSSSDHTVILSDKDLGNDPKIWKNININGNTVIESSDFEWDFVKFNDIYTKLQYLSAQISTSCKSYKQYIEYRKPILDRVRQIYNNFCGGTIEFPWESAYKAKFMNSGTDDHSGYQYAEGGSIDHQSVGILDYIFKSDDLIKDYIFSPKSWVFCGNDNEEPERGYYNTYNIRMDDYSETVEAIASIDLGQPIGIVEFNLPGFLNDIEYNSEFELLEDIYYKKDEPGIPIQLGERKDIYPNLIDYIDNNLLTYLEPRFKYVVEYKGEYIALFVDPLVRDFYKRSNKSVGEDSKILDMIFSDFTEGKNYIKKTLRFHTDKFGDL